MWSSVEDYLYLQSYLLLFEKKISHLWHSAISSPHVLWIMKVNLVEICGCMSWSIYADRKMYKVPSNKLKHFLIFFSCLSIQFCPPNSWPRWGSWTVKSLSRYVGEIDLIGLRCQCWDKIWWRNCGNQLSCYFFYFFQLMDLKSTEKESGKMNARTCWFSPCSSLHNKLGRGRVAL